MARLWQVFFAALAVLPDAVLASFGTGVPIGCYVWNMEGVNAKKSATASTAPECQVACAENAGCTHFTFFQNGNVCQISENDAPAEFVRNYERAAVSGPAHCASPIAEACTELPEAGFPGADAVASMNAWPTNYQPQGLQCWPRTSPTELRSCSNVTVLQDVALSWPGQCLGLGPMTPPEGESCEEACRKDNNCPAWTQMQDGACYHGLGTDCFMNHETARPVQGQRLMHGSYRVLKDMIGLQVMGLQKVFGNDDMEVMAAKGLAPADMCRNICLSSLACQFWQLMNTSGCYIERYDNPIGYPLTLAEIGFDNAADVLAGEMIQHYCPALMVPGYASSLPSQLSQLTNVSSGDIAEQLDEMAGVDTTTLESFVMDTEGLPSASIPSGSPVSSPGVSYANPQSSPGNCYLTAPAVKGQQILQVTGVAGFLQGQGISIGGVEENKVTGFGTGSMLLESPLASAWPQQTLVTAQNDTSSSWPWWGTVLFILASLLLVAAVVSAVIFFLRSRSHDKRSRGLAAGVDGFMYDADEDDYMDDPYQSGFSTYSQPYSSYDTVGSRAPSYAESFATSIPTQYAESFATSMPTQMSMPTQVPPFMYQPQMMNVWPRPY